MLKSVEGKAQNWKGRMAVMGLFSLVGASAVLGALLMWHSPEAGEVLEGNSLAVGYGGEVAGYLPGYALHEGVAMYYATLKEATDNCNNNALCHGVTKGTDGRYSTRSGLTTNASPNGEVSRLKLAKGYGAAENGYLPGYASAAGTQFPSIEEAMAACDADAVCNGITLSSAGTYSTRAGTETKPSPYGEVSHLKAYFKDYSSAVDGYLQSWDPNPPYFKTLGEAVAVCDADDLCKGVTKGDFGFSMRSGITPMASPYSEKSFRRLGGMPPPTKPLPPILPPIFVPHPTTPSEDVVLPQVVV